MINNWQREIARFTPDLAALVHHGPSRHQRDEFREQAQSHQVIITSYGTMNRDRELLASLPWRAVILDEAQNIKNPASQQAGAARSIPADYRVALTGTPVENHVGDLWSIMQFLNPGLLGTQAEFKRNYFQPIQSGRDEAATARLQKATGPFILRRLKTDRSIIDDLPDKNETKQYCNLTREQATLYEAVLREAETRLESAEGMERRGSILDTLTKLKQACNHPRQLLGDNSAIAGRSGKLARLQELLGRAVARRRPGADFQPVRRDGRHPATARAGDLRPGSSLPPRRRLPQPAGPDGTALPERTPTARRSSSCPSRPEAPA